MSRCKTHCRISSNRLALRHGALDQRKSFSNPVCTAQAACLITDIRMPKMSGLELQSRLKDEECSVPIIFITAHGDTRMRIRAMREGAVEFLAKPFDHQVLLKRVRAALDM